MVESTVDLLVAEMVLYLVGDLALLTVVNLATPVAVSMDNEMVGESVGVKGNLKVVS